MPIYLVFVLTLLSGLTQQISRVVFALYALDLGAQPFTVGILAAAFSVFPMLFSVTAGQLADRFGARWPLMFGAFASGLGIMSAYFVSSIPVIFFAAAMTGLSTSIYNVSLQNLAGQLSNARTRTRNFSNYTLINSFTGFIGPLFAGLSIDHSGYAVTSLYLALITLAPVLALALWGKLLPGGASLTIRSGTGIRTTLSQPGVRRMLATSSLQNAADFMYQFYFPVYMHNIGLSASIIGSVLSMYAIAAFIARLALPRVIARVRGETVLAYTFYMGAAGMMLIPFFTNAAVLALIAFIYGLGMGGGGPIVIMLTYSSSPQGRSGETLGLKLTVNHLTKVVSRHVEEHQRLAQMMVGPESAYSARRDRNHSAGLAAPRALTIRPRADVDRVFHDRRHGTVVFRSHEQDPVGALDALPELHPRLRGRLLFVLVEEGQLADLDDSQLNFCGSEHRQRLCRPAAVGFLAQAADYDRHIQRLIHVLLLFNWENRVVSALSRAVVHMDRV